MRNSLAFRPMSYFLFKTFKMLVEKITAKLLTDSKLSVYFFPTIEYFFQEIISNLLVILNRANKNKITILDLENLFSGERFKGNLSILESSFQLLRNFNILSPQKYLRSKKKFPKPRKIKIFLSQNWFFTSPTNKTNLKYQKFLKTSQTFFRNPNFIIPLEQEILIKYVVSRIKTGNIKEQELCLDFISKNQNFDQNFSLLLFYLKFFVRKKKKNPGMVLKALKFIRHLFSNSYIKGESFKGIVMPLLLGCIFCKLKNEKYDEFWNLKIYSSSFVGFFYEKIVFRNFFFLKKILKTFLKVILFKPEKLSLIFGSFSGLSFLGSPEMELFAIPYILFFSENKKRKKKAFKKKKFGQQKFNRLFQSIFFSYFPRGGRKSYGNINFESLDKVSEIFSFFKITNK